MRILLFLLAAAACFAQQIGLGVKGGARLTTQIQGSADDQSRRYIVGPMVEVLLPYGFAVEVDALYSRFGYSSSDSFPGLFFSTNRARGNSWQFPIVAKYRFHSQPFHPYVLLGYVAQHTSGNEVDSGIQINPTTGAQSPFAGSYALGYGTNSGLASGAGFELGAGHIHVAPELRYIRWKDPLFQDYGSHGYYLAAPQNEFQLMVGVTWR